MVFYMGGNRARYSMVTPIKGVFIGNYRKEKQT